MNSEAKNEWTEKMESPGNFFEGKMGVRIGELGEFRGKVHTGERIQNWKANEETKGIHFLN